MAESRNIGEQIRDAVQEAIASQDFSTLRDTVEHSINAATISITEGLAQASEQARKAQAQRAQQQSQTPDAGTTPYNQAYHPQQNHPYGYAPGAQPPSHGVYQTQQASPQQSQGSARPRPIPQNQPSFRGNRQNQAYLERQAQRQAQELERRKMVELENQRFAKVGGLTAQGFVLGIIGIPSLILFVSGAVFFFINYVVAANPAMLGSGIVSSIISVLMGWLSYVGTSRVGIARRFKTYQRLIGTRSFINVEELVAHTGKSTRYIVKDLKKMLAKGMFKQGHLVENDTCLIVTHEEYQHYQQSLIAAEERQRQQRLVKSVEPKTDKAQLSAEEQAILARGNAYIAAIRASNDAIPDPAVSKKIDQIEVVVQKIFERAREHPEVIGDLERLMDYYLPTTVKLLDAYRDLDQQPVQGETIQTSKREIEATLDTLSVAFEKLLDSIFRDMAWDVSSDISVLHAVLAQEGLAEDPFSSMRKQS